MRLPWRGGKATPDTFRCASCGQVHAGPVFAFAAPAPLAWEALPAAERREPSVLDGELCVIRGTDFFIRGLIEIPVIGSDQVFAWNVWSSLSKANFDRAVQMWDRPERVSEPPYFGWLANDLAMAYPTTLNLKLNVHSRELGRRPFLEVKPTDHPLALEQRNGISLERVHQINARILHGN